MAFVLGAGSLKELAGVHPRLVAVVHRAIQITKVDFGVHDGLRTVDEQRAYVKRGVSQTMNSMHRTQADGYGHAVDLVPYINGKLRWEWPPIFEIAAAVAQAAELTGARVRWGGCWTVINDAHATPVSMEALEEAYVARRRADGKRAFPDGPHYEIVL